MELLNGLGEPITPVFNNQLIHLKAPSGPKPGWMRPRLTESQLARLSGSPEPEAPELVKSPPEPLKKTREYAFKIFKQNYYEVYVYASIKTLLERDTKGLYNLAKRGLVKNLIGYKSKINYELSNHKYLKINTKTLSTYSCIKKILKYTKTID